MRIGLRVLVAAAWLVVPSLASAADDKTIATDLFDKGVKKMEQGHCDAPPMKDVAICKEARESFKRAYEIYPAGLGALRNLAYVERTLGLYASAARSFRELERKAPSDPNPKRHVWADYARKELVTLEPLVPHVTIKVSNAPAGAKVELDGAPLPAPAWNTSIDVDPGEHVVRGEAAGQPAIEKSFKIAEKEEQTLEIAFEVIAPEPPPDTPPPPPVVASEPPSRVPALITMAVGAVGVGVGLGFGWAAISKRKEACGESDLCDRQGLEDGRSLARTSNIVTGVGAAVLVGGVVWFLLTPSSSDKKDQAAHVVPYASKDGAGLGFFARF